MVDGITQKQYGNKVLIIIEWYGEVKEWEMRERKRHHRGSCRVESECEGAEAKKPKAVIEGRWM